ncbi:hypothetical protein [Nocardia sp. NPDC057455]|uniref:hypothetical protein n=1 Tax=Nocardia sp. NPDC057455 TaxID=3346138 RepID=UPI003671A415
MTTTTYPGTRNAKDGILLARALWATMECDPEDSSPPWQAVPRAVHDRYIDRAAALERALEDLGWTAPGNDAPPQRWTSAAAVPIGVRFRPVGTIRIFERLAGGLCREIRRDGSGSRRCVTVVDRLACRGLIEAR